MSDLIAESKELLRKLNAVSRKSFGQNFMISEKDLLFISESLEASSEDEVVEIGPGLGFLTRYLISNSKRIILIEKDKAFAEYLADQILTGDAGGESSIFLKKNYLRKIESRRRQDPSKSAPNTLQIINQDILKISIENDIKPGAPIKVIGNIPYNITSPILEWLISQKSLISVAVLTVQKEVAERLAAKPGNKTWGSLSVFVQFHAKLEFLKVIPRTGFYPPPKVDSAVIRLTFPEKPLYAVKNEALFSSIVRRAFQKRRKTVLNALLNPSEEKFTKNNLTSALEKTKIVPIRRPETLSISEWVALSGSL